MDVQKQITKRSRGDAIIKLQDASPTLGVHLHQNVPNPRFIARVFEGDIMRIAVNGLGTLAGWKQILCQKQHGDVSVMRVFGEQIQHALVLSPFGHQIVQNQDASLGKPLGQLSRVGNPLVKLNALSFHAVKPRLPSIVRIHHLFRWGLKHFFLPQQTFHQHRLAAAAGGGDDDAGGVANHNGIETARGLCLL